MDAGLQSLLTAAILTLAALGFLVLRFISRLLLIRRTWLEDYLLSSAFLLSAGFTLIVGLFWKHGMGRLDTSVDPSDIKTLYKLVYASIIIYNGGLVLVKLSILIQYLHFFTTRVYRFSAWALIILISSAGVALIFTSLFSCHPINAYWEEPIEKQHCINRLAFWYAISSFHIATDLAVWFLPLPILKSLKLPSYQKFSLMMVFALGGFDCITAGLRLNALRNAYHEETGIFGHAGVATWSSAEINIGIICACLPTLQPLISRVSSRRWSRDIRRASNEANSTTELGRIDCEHDSSKEGLAVQAELEAQNV